MGLVWEAQGPPKGAPSGAHKILPSVFLLGKSPNPMGKHRKTYALREHFWHLEYSDYNVGWPTPTMGAILAGIPVVLFKDWLWWWWIEWWRPCHFNRQRHSRENSTWFFLLIVHKSNDGYRFMVGFNSDLGSFNSLPQTLPFTRNPANFCISSIHFGGPMCADPCLDGLETDLVRLWHAYLGACELFSWN